MEHSLSSLAFKGSIMEAVTEAKQQKKLFVVYLSGDNLESNHLEESTWTDSSVAESVSKYCVLLHIPEGSADAANFSAIYPQKSAPCITAIGYSGVQVWQSEGFVAADHLASSLEKAWLSLHIQETTATFLSSALASKKDLSSGTSNSASLEQGSSSTTNEQSPPTDRSKSRLTENSEIKADKDLHKHVVEGPKSKMSDEASPESVFPDKSESGEFATTTKTLKESSNSRLVDPYISDRQGANAQESLDLLDKHVVPEAREAMQMKGYENVEVQRSGISDCTNKSTDAHLHIRLPDGSSLQVKFSLMDTLAMVKDYVNKNRTSSFGSYDLAIPYPRRVFDDEDLDKQLTELGLSNRQALIVVLRHRDSSRPRGGLISRNQTNASNHVGSPSASDEGYWAFLRRMLSYVNPFSYLAGGPSTSSSAQDNQSGMWQYGPIPSRQNDLRGARGPYTASSSNQSTASAGGSSTSKSKQKTPARWGSNIHTLKHDEDDSRFNDKNAFWNGNSTQYGGGDGKQE